VTLLFRPQPKVEHKRVPKTISIPTNFSSVIAQLITSESFTPVDSWKVADTAKPVRSPGKPIDVTTPRVVTFDIDFSSFTKGDHVLLAIAHRVPDQGTDTGPTLTGATLEELVLKNVQAAARIVTVTD
jgi:hypothetical protein